MTLLNRISEMKTASPIDSLLCLGFHKLTLVSICDDDVLMKRPMQYSPRAGFLSRHVREN